MLTPSMTYQLRKISSLLLMSLLLSLVVPFSTQAQYNDKKVTETVDGQKVYVHIVKKGQTLYGIARHYEVELDAVVKRNPELKEGLKLNQTIYIPVPGSSKSNVKPLKEPKAKAVAKTVKEVKVAPKLGPGERLHEVQAKETLYSLSRKYGVSVGVIKAANNGLPEGLKLGDSVVIPTLDEVPLNSKPSKPTPLATSKPIVKSSQRSHVVAAGETRFSLSQKYKVSIDALDKANGNWPDGVRVGETIVIPDASAETATAEWKPKPKPASLIPPRDSDFLPDTVILKPIYNVALLLPLYLDMNDTVQLEEEDPNRAMRPEIYPRSKVALDFYLGARLAVDSLEKSGLLVKFHVYDTRNDSATVIDLLHREEMEKMNLFIGPLYKSNFELVAAFAKSRQINIVSPVHQSNRLLLDNPQVSKVAPSLAVQSEALAKYVFEHHGTENLVLVNSMKLRDQYWVDAFKRDTRKIYLKADSSSTDSIAELQLYKVSRTNLLSVLQKDIVNVFVVPSNNRAFVSEMLIQLNELKEDYSIMVFGLDRWQTYDNLEAEFLHDLQVHIVSLSYVNYASKEVNDFLTSYRSRFRTDPAKYAFLGFDVTYFYLRALQKHGIAFQNYLGSMTETSTSVVFDYFKTGMEHGFENENVFILRYRNYQLEIAN